MAYFRNGQLGVCVTRGRGAPNVSKLNEHREIWVVSAKTGRVFIPWGCIKFHGQGGFSAKDFVAVF